MIQYSYFIQFAITFRQQKHPSAISALYCSSDKVRQYEIQFKKYLTFSNYTERIKFSNLRKLECISDRNNSMLFHVSRASTASSLRVAEEN